MRTNRLDLMHDYVRAIHRSLTGRDPPEPGNSIEAPAPSFDEVVRRFSELEAIARSRPNIADRVPAFAFAPPMDLIGTERELTVELGVPGVERGDVDVELHDDELTISGARVASASLDGRIFFHAELPRGPFRRVIRLPESTTGAPRVEVENGIVRIKLARAKGSPLPRA